MGNDDNSTKAIASLELDWTTGEFYLCDAEHVTSAAITARRGAALHGVCQNIARA